MHIEARLQQLGLALPGPVTPPAGVRLPFAFVRVRGNRGFVSGHGPLNVDGSLAQPLGKLGRELTVDEGYRAARLTALAILGSLKRELGDLDRVQAWLRVFGIAPSPPGFPHHPPVTHASPPLLIHPPPPNPPTPPPPPPPP